jgi:hypothetical protein
MTFEKVIKLGGEWLCYVPIIHILLPIKDIWIGFTSFFGQRGEKCLEIE